MGDQKAVATEDRTARLTVLIDPRKKAVFEKLCASEDVTPSQVVRRLIRGYIEQKLGRPWGSERARSGSEGPAPPARSIRPRRPARR
jgi:hypothetical protein